MMTMSTSGHGLTFQHFRKNEECGVLEELEPIDQNFNYDFNFQQYNHLARERVVLPVSMAGMCLQLIIMNSNSRVIFWH